MKSEFDILKYNENWSELFLIEKKKLTVVFGDNLNSIHHIGSTAIPTTKSKPEIDILVVVKDDFLIPMHDELIEGLGYAIRGECLDSGGIAGRFYYSKDIDNRRRHKLHVCKVGHTDIMSKLIFVKYLVAHKDVASEYADLKTALSTKYNYGRGIEKYLSCKSEFINERLDMARVEYKEIEYKDFI